MMSTSTTQRGFWIPVAYSGRRICNTGFVYFFCQSIGTLLLIQTPILVFARMNIVFRLNPLKMDINSE